MPILVVDKTDNKAPARVCETYAHDHDSAYANKIICINWSNAPSQLKLDVSLPKKPSEEVRMRHMTAGKEGISSIYWQSMSADISDSE